MSYLADTWRSWKWQDKVFTAGEVVFLTSLLPSVFSDQKPSPVTSFATALMLYLFLLVHASYGLWIAFALTVVTASLWVTLGVQAL